MRLGLAQVNPTVGDLDGNLDRCVAAAESGASAGADLTVLPEMVIPGHHPGDLLLDRGFVAAVAQATRELALRVRGPVIAGTVLPARRAPPSHPGLLNVAALLRDGRWESSAPQRLLASHDVSFDARWFVAGETAPIATVAGRPCGLLIGTDLLLAHHGVDPPAELASAGADLILCSAASPLGTVTAEQRLARAARCPAPVAFVNACGGNDGLILDGRSFLTDGRGGLLALLPAFDEDVRVVDLTDPDPIVPSPGGGHEELLRALVLGVRDFARKNRIARAFLGLSGGIDSSLVAVIAAEALGPSRVTGVAMPSRFTDPRSTSCARDLAASLGIGFEEVSIEPLHRTAEATLGHLLDQGTGAENIQARLRTAILMAFVNRFGGMLLNTSNKTELALGYGTLYGDLAGALCPIGDLTKTAVMDLAGWLATTSGAIPPFALERPPTAELRPDQVDPWDYRTLSPELEHAVREHLSHPVLVRSEHKRRQLGVVLKVSPCTFGPGRMVPLTRR